MSSWRVAAAQLRAALEAAPHTRVAAQQLRVLHQILGPAQPLRTATLEARAALNADPRTRTAALEARALVEVLPDLPDSGHPFQWHRVDEDAASGWAVDVGRSEGMVTFTATHGRTDASSRPAPSQVTVVLATAWAATPELGDVFRVVCTAGLLPASSKSSDRVRFTGEVTDVVHDPAAGTLTVTGVGQLGRQGRARVDGRGMGRQLDGTRVAAVLERIGATAGDVDGGTAQLLPPEQADTTGDQLLERVAVSTGGQVVEQRTGRVDYHDAEHRRGQLAQLELPAGDVLADGFTWQQRVGDLVNVAEVTWGRPGVVLRVLDHDSADTRGEYPGSLVTDLVDQSAAHARGSELVGRRSTPYWQLPAVQVDLRRTVDLEARGQLAALSMGDRIRVTGLPAGGPFVDGDVFVEGTTEQAWRTPRDPYADPADPTGLTEPTARDAWRLALAVTDPRQSGVSVRWVDVPASLTWDGVDPELTWLDLARIEDPTELPAPPAP